MSVHWTPSIFGSPYIDTCPTLLEGESPLKITLTTRADAFSPRGVPLIAGADNVDLGVLSTLKFEVCFGRLALTLP